jgi:hypothetical protein
VTFHGRNGDHEFGRHSGIRVAFGDEGEHFRLALRQTVDRAAPAPAPHQAGDDVRVERRPTLGDTSHGIGEDAQVADLLLQQVPDTLRTVGDQVERIPVLKKLGQDQHANIGLPRADLQCRAQPVIGVIRRHLDVGNHDVRAIRARLPDEVARIGGGPDDLEPAVLQNMDDARAHDGLILADEYPNLRWLGHGTKLRGWRPRANGMHNPTGSKRPAGCPFQASLASTRAYHQRPPIRLASRLPLESTFRRLDGVRPMGQREWLPTHDGAARSGACVLRRVFHAPAGDDFSTSRAGIVPLDQRRPMWHFMGLWTTFVAGFSFMVPGFVMYDGGFSLAAAAGASLLGYGIYVANALIGSYLGAQSGQTLTLLTRAVFGRAGSWLVSLLVMIPALGWVGFQAGVLTQLWYGFYGWGNWRSSR